MVQTATAEPAAKRLLGAPGRFRAKAADTYRGWGTSPEERAWAWECKEYAPEPHNDFWRAVEIDAPKDVVALALPD